MNKHVLGAGEEAQHLRALTAFVENQYLVPSTDVGQFTVAYI